MSLQAGRQAALLSRARLRMTGMTPCQQRPMTGDAEVQLAHAVSGLQQPQAYACRLTALQQAAAARGHAQPKAALLRAQNLQVRQDDSPCLPAMSRNGRQSMPHHSPSASSGFTQSLLILSTLTASVKQWPVMSSMAAPRTGLLQATWPVATQGINPRGLCLFGFCIWLLGCRCCLRALRSSLYMHTRLPA